MTDIIDELKIKTLNCTVPSWAARAVHEIEQLRKRNAELEDKLVLLRAQDPVCPELPDTLIRWANLPNVEPELTDKSTKGEWRSDGYAAARSWVKMQLDLMKDGA